MVVKKENYLPSPPGAGAPTGMRRMFIRADQWWNFSSIPAGWQTR
ncbi:hypothetical protein PATSB16_13040 [Pandoraea thiooxydans]|nr:hypothetical protein PATSB16_13040 [Pandoraea thiooxydans]